MLGKTYDEQGDDVIQQFKCLTCDGEKLFEYDPEEGVLSIVDNSIPIGIY